MKIADTHDDSKNPMVKQKSVCRTFSKYVCIFYRVFSLDMKSITI